MPEKVRVTIMEPSGSKEIEVGIPLEWTVDRAISELKKKLQLSGPLTAQLKRTQSELDPARTIKQEGIQDGDVIRLRPRQVGGVSPRQKRLLNDYNSLLELKQQSNGVIDFKVDKHYQHYVVTVKGIDSLIRTNGKEKFSKSDSHVFDIALSPQYPDAAPRVRFRKAIFHPNWYPDGRVCYADNRWNVISRLSELVIDIIRMMTFEIVATRSPASISALGWYRENKSRIEAMLENRGSLLLQKCPVESDGLDFY